MRNRLKEFKEDTAPQPMRFSDIYSKNGRHLITVVFILENLLDNTYQSHLSRLKYAPVNPATGIQGVFNMGMNFAFKVIVPYGIKG